MTAEISIVQGRNPAETRESNIRYALSHGVCPYCLLALQVVRGGVRCECGFRIHESEF